MTALMTVGLLAAACEDATGPETLSSLTIAPTTQTVAVGETVQFSAAGARAGIDVTNLEGEVWSVAGGGTVGDSGLFTAGTTPGTSTITVTCGGLTATATVVVTAGPLATITVTPNPATMEIGATQQFTAVGHDAGGNPVDIDATWSVVDGGGTIDAGTGLFTAGNTTGTFENTVTATQGSISGTATVVVTAGPLATITVTPDPAILVTNEEQQFTAVGLDAGGNPVEIDATWSVVDGGGNIDADTGRFTAGTTIGTYSNTVTATQGTISGTATVIVTAGPLVSITVTPDPATLQPDETQRFRADGVDVDGNVVELVPVWSVENGGGTINSSTGRFTAGSTLGTFNNTVVATQGSLSGNATVIVEMAVLATITVEPDPASVQTGAQQTFTAVGRDSDGDIVPITPVWSTTNPPGTINSSTGVFTAGNTTGTFNDAVTATDGAISGSATVTVTAAPPPAPGSDFAILANSTVTCTEGVITGEIGTFLNAPGVSIVTSCPNSGIEEGTPDAVDAYNDFLTTYDTLEATACDVVLTGTLAGVTLAPGVYCFDAAATLTGVLTLNGPSNGVWLIKAGTLSPGSLSGTDFEVVMAGSANRCNVTWWSQGAATMTDSDLKGNVLAGADITLTRETFGGNAWAKGDVTVTETAVTGCS
ncbi:MAG: ice-binding family protein [Gemmatimonadota bacterium]